MQQTLYKTLFRLSGCVAILLVLAGCAAEQATARMSGTALPVPTVAPMFGKDRVTPVPLPTSTPSPLLSRRSSPSNTNPDGMENMIAVPVYKDWLAPGWSMEYMISLECNPSEWSYVYQGNNAIRCMPTANEGAMLLFTLSAEARDAYRRDRVLGVSFYLSGGQDYIDTDALAVSMQGSNINTYWVGTDTSAQIAGRDTATADTPRFSETRLYYLGINRAIAPGEWARVVLWLDDLPYDPDYMYVTGFYLKTGTDYLQQFYVDEVSLLVAAQ